MFYRFQSSPTSQGGRYHVSQGKQPNRYCFNPRPPRKVGATVLAPIMETLKQLFQSSPTSQGGRYPCRIPEQLFL